MALVRLQTERLSIGVSNSDSNYREEYQLALALVDAINGFDGGLAAGKLGSWPGLGRKVVELLAGNLKLKVVETDLPPVADPGVVRK